MSSEGKVLLFGSCRATPAVRLPQSSCVCRAAAEDQMGKAWSQEFPPLLGNISVGSKMQSPNLTYKNHGWFCGQTLSQGMGRRDLSPWETSGVWGCIYINMPWFELLPLCECAPFSFGAHLSHWAVHWASLWVLQQFLSLVRDVLRRQPAPNIWR